MKTLLLATLLALSGCQTTNQRCDFYPDGLIEHYRLRATVIGTGETEVITTACTELAMSTKDTGLSDNGVAALGMIAEGAVKGFMPMPISDPFNNPGPGSTFNSVATEDLP